MNLEGSRPTQPARAGFQFPFQIHQDRLRLSGGGAHGHIQRLPLSRCDFRFQRGERKRERRVLGRGDIGHAAAESKPAVHHQNQRFAGVDRPEIQHDSVWFCQSAELRDAQRRRRHAPAIQRLQCRGDLLPIQRLSLLQRMLVVERHQRALRKWPARKQLVRGMHFRAWLVVHHHQFCFVQIEHFTQLLGDLKLVVSVARNEGLLVSNPNQLFRIGLDIAALGHRQTERRSSQNICDKLEPFSIPHIHVGTGAFLDRQLQSEERLPAIERQFRRALGPVEPMHQKRIQLLVFPDAQLHRQALNRPDQAQPAGFDLDFAAKPAGVGTSPEQPHFDLRIGVAALIAQETQSPVRQGDDDIRIAVQIEISEVDFRHRAAIELIEAELSGLLLKSGEAEIPPDPDFFSDQPEIQPTVAVIID